jgi:hypothetical protein
MQRSTSARDETIFAPARSHRETKQHYVEVLKIWGPPMATREDLISGICLGVMIVGIAVLGSGLAALVLT